eukprot:735464-Rhodomonas_salina.1
MMRSGMPPPGWGHPHMPMHHHYPGQTRPPFCLFFFFLSVEGTVLAPSLLYGVVLARWYHAPGCGTDAVVPGCALYQGTRRLPTRPPTTCSL